MLPKAVDREITTSKEVVLRNWRLSRLCGSTQNAYIEQFKRTAKHEGLDAHEFNSIAHPQLLATRWLWHYNHERPNSAILRQSIKAAANGSLNFY